MVLIIGSISKDVPLLQSLYNFCTELCRQSLLKTCLILYPSDPDARTWIQPFVHSLKSVGIQRVNLLIPTSSFEPEDVEVIEAMGIPEIILIEDDFDYLFINSEKLHVRVWLTWTDSEKNHEKFCTWNEFISDLLSVEVSPFRFVQDNKPVTATPSQPTSGACQLQDAIVTVCSHGSIELNLHGPGEHQLALHDHECSSAARYFSFWKDKLPLKVYCRDCGPGSMLDFPAWMDAPDEIVQVEQEGRYFLDHVKGDLMKMSDMQRGVVTNGFIDRVKQNAVK